MSKSTQAPHQSTGIGSGGDDRNLRTSSIEAAEAVDRRYLAATTNSTKTPGYSPFYRPLDKDR
jgi:hypothetical protein